MPSATSTTALTFRSPAGADPGVYQVAIPRPRLLHAGESSLFCAAVATMHWGLGCLMGSVCAAAMAASDACCAPLARPALHCWPQVRPVNDEDKLARLDTLPAGEMRPEFK